jgi:hypothetical protein
MQKCRVFGRVAVLVAAGMFIFGSVYAQEKPYEKTGQDTGGEKIAMVLENDYLKLAVSEKGKPVELLGKLTGEDYCTGKTSALFSLKKGKRTYAPSLCSYKDGRLTVEFGESGTTAVIKVICKKQYFAFEVISVSGDDVDELTFLNITVKTRKQISNSAGVAADDNFGFRLPLLQ